MRRLLCYVFALGIAAVPARALADPWAREVAVQDLWSITSESDVALRAGPATSWERLELMRAGTPVRVL
jgi:hypothetical protein